MVVFIMTVIQRLSGTKKMKWYEALSGTKRELKPLKSWQKVFDVNAFENEFCQNGRYILEHLGSFRRYVFDVHYVRCSEWA